MTNGKIKPLLKAVETAFKQLHKSGKYKPEDVAGTDAYKNLVIETSAIFESGIQDNKIPEAMLTALKEDVFVFSALKTHAQLSEASKLLLDDKGVVKSFSLFSNDVSKIKENYNQNYLEAEYQFAVSSAQSAGNWASVSADYDLQYRTAGDSKVRDSHDKLRDTTLPSDDAFWLSYYPPNGWRCFLPETLILTVKGWQEIQDIQPRDWLIGGSGNKQFVGQIHTNTFNGNIVRLFSKRKQVSCTPNHRFLTQNGWVMSEFINRGDIIIQVGKIGLLNKIMNAIHNTKTLILYGLMSFKRKRKAV